MTITDRLNLGVGRRLPLLLQTEAAECGLVCVAMIAGYFGRSEEPADLRRRFGLSLRGATLRDLVGLADQLNMASRPVRVDMHELEMLSTPCILHWDLNHFVVLKSITGDRVVIHDPDQGLRRLTRDQVSRHFSGVALELTPTGGFQAAAPRPRLRIRALLGHMVGIRRSLLQVLALALAIELFALVSPLFLVWVVDHALVGGDRGLLVTLVVGFTLLLLIHVAVSTMRAWMLMGVGATLKVQARTNLFSHLVNLPPRFFEARYTGDVMSRFGSQETILQAITTELVIGVLDGLMCVLTIVIMVVIAPGLTAIVLGAALLYALLRWVLYRPLRQASEEAIVWMAKRDSHFLETLRGMTAIKLFNGQEDRRARWLNLLVETVNRQITTQKLDLLFKNGNLLLLGLLTILIVWLGALQVMAGASTIGLLLGFIAYKELFIQRVSVLINRIVDLQMLRLHADRVADIALTEPEPRGRVGERGDHHPPLSLEMRNVWFRYGASDPWVLKDVSFRIGAGESLAIAGPSGCGKSTMLKLLAGLAEPDEGCIYVNGEPLARIGLDRYRAMIGVVMQDDQLFAGSIADNICFFAARPDRAQIEECARLAAVHDDIMAMPMGYATLIGDMGTVLSGGQKQRVLIARALYRGPGLLLLDEATSHLDVTRESAVNRAIAGTAMTRIVIAHRPETIRASDRVLHFDDGRLLSQEPAVAALGGALDASCNPLTQPLARVGERSMIDASTL